MKKIGILTFFWTTNPGTVMQAFAVMSLLREKFKEYQIELINYAPKKIKTKFIRNYFKPRSFLNGVRYFKKIYAYNSFRKNVLGLKSKPFRDKNYQEAVNFVKKSNYDAIVVGSDVVWDIANMEERKLPLFPNIYWLSPEITAKKIAFSASASTTTPERLDANTKNKLCSLAHTFDLIGVRDDVTERLLKTCCNNIDFSRTPDPTFGINIQKTKIKQKLKKIGLNLNKPIAGIRLPDADGFRNALIQYLKQNDYQILSLDNALEKGIYSTPAITPFEWADLFQYLTVTFTGKFHGTVYSIKNRIPVIVIDTQPIAFTEDGDSRTSSLLKEFGLYDSCHFNIRDIGSNYSAFFKKIDDAINTFNNQNIEIKLQEMRNRCKEFAKRMDQII